MNTKSDGSYSYHWATNSSLLFGISGTFAGYKAFFIVGKQYRSERV